MLNLKMLELISTGLDSIRTIPLRLRALPENIIIGCKTAGGRVPLILTRQERNWGKTLRSAWATERLGSTGTEGVF
jgi:hypothetical protein